MLYDEALYGLAVSNEVEFLPWRVWISIWTLIIGLLVAGLEGSIVVNFFTNFTKEILAALISIDCLHLRIFDQDGRIF